MNYAVSVSRRQRRRQRHGCTHRIEQVVQSILAHRLELVLGLVAGLRAVVVVAALPRPRTGGALRPPLGGTRIGRDGRRVLVAMAVHGLDGGRRALGGEGFGYALLRHDDGSIERGALGGDDLRAQRARGGRVDEARVARVLDAMHNGGLAVVGIGQGGLALEASVGARAAADLVDWRLGSWRQDTRGRGQRSPACHRGLAGGDAGPLYVVRRVPSTRTALRQWGGSSCKRTQGLARAGQREAEGRGGCYKLGHDSSLRGRVAGLLKRAMKQLMGHSHMPPFCFRSSSGGRWGAARLGSRPRAGHGTSWKCGPVWHSVTVQKGRRIQAPGAPPPARS